MQVPAADREEPQRYAAVTRDSLVLLKTSINDLLSIPLHAIEEDNPLLQDCTARKVPSPHQDALIQHSLDLHEQIKTAFHSVKKYNRMADPGKASKPPPADEGIDALLSKWVRARNGDGLDDENPEEVQELAAQRKAGKSKPYNVLQC